MPVLVIVLSILSGWFLTLISLKLMQMLQLSSYRASGLIAWFKRTKYDYVVRYFALSFFGFTSMFVFIMCFGRSSVYYLGYIFFALLCLYFVFAVMKEKQKTPLKFTARITRLVIVDFILNSLITFALLWFTEETFFMYSFVGLLPLLSPLILLLAHFIVLPLEKAIGSVYIAKAVKKLKASSPIVIGITGSYGKTTAKNILASFLRAKYSVFASPQSYNTPMGLCKCINEHYDGEKIFIAEMGARFTGDIRYLKKLFKPQYAVLTSIGNQHLETFGSKENIVKEKLSVTEGVEYSVANGDCEDIVANNMFGAILCGKEGDVTYSNVKADIFGTSFTLKIFGDDAEISTPLIGEHIPVTVALCAAMAMKLGVSAHEIVESCKSLEFIKHRMEIIRNGEMTIIDDSYNSNPSGADSALNILSTYKGTKVIITPGFVELGADAENCLKTLGNKIASVCDHAFLVGPNAQMIKSGMGDFENASIVKNLDEAMDGLKNIAVPMAVLFENDLPDNY